MSTSNKKDVWLWPNLVVVSENAWDAECTDSHQDSFNFCRLKAKAMLGGIFKQEQGSSKKLLMYKSRTTSFSRAAGRTSLKSLGAEKEEMPLRLIKVTCSGFENVFVMSKCMRQQVKDTAESQKGTQNRGLIVLQHPRGGDWVNTNEKEQQCSGKPQQEPLAALQMSKTSPNMKLPVSEPRW